MLKWSSFVCLLSILTLSSCSTWTQISDAYEAAADNPVLMPSLSRGTQRASDEKKESKQEKVKPIVKTLTSPETDSTEATTPELKTIENIEPVETIKPVKAPAKTPVYANRNEGRVPTPEQQQAALEVLKSQNDTPSVKPVTPTSVPAEPAVPTGVISTPTVTPVIPTSTPKAEPKDEPEVLPAPRPTSIELRGLRAPNLPSNLPMEVKG